MNYVTSEVREMTYELGRAEYNRSYFLSDGIYPNFTYFMNTMREEHAYYTAWQERRRKDIESAFGRMQIEWEILQTGVERHV